LKYLDSKKYFRKKEYDFKNFEKIEKNFVIVLKINGKCDKLNKLLNKRYSAFIVATSFVKDL